MTDSVQRQPNRRSIRLQEYDYAQAGAYFVTICTHNRECLFGEIVDGEVRLNDAGRMIQAVWDGLPERFDNLGLDQFTIMPNHVHGIMVLNRRGESRIRLFHRTTPGRRACYAASGIAEPIPFQSVWESDSFFS